MNTIEYLLSCLAEECAEVGQRCSKAQRFGLDEVYPYTGLTNEEAICLEFNDILATIELLQFYGISLKDIGNRKAITTKKEKVIKYMKYSKELGTLKD